MRPGGGLYFTDPFYARPWWAHSTMPQDGQHVYYLAPGAKTLVRVTDDLVQPNGIVGSPDGKTLYVADIGAKKTWRYAIRPDGTLAGKALVCEEGSDGMTLDDEGNLYLTGDGVKVFDAKGQLIEHDQGARAVDRERGLLRQGPPDALHHRQQGALLDRHPHARRRPGQVSAERARARRGHAGRQRRGERDEAAVV